MKLSVCICCLKKCIAIADKEGIIVKLCTKLFSRKTKSTEADKSETPSICFKCYLRLKLCYVYRQSFMCLYKHLRKPNQRDSVEIIADLKNVPIISNCPICFMPQPSTKHIYEHLLHQQQGEECNKNTQSLYDYDRLTCERHEGRRGKTVHAYYCRGMCGAWFKRKYLRDTHQLGCNNVLKVLKTESGDTSDTLTVASCYSPICTLLELQEPDGSSEDKKLVVTNDFSSTNTACTPINRKPKISRKKTKNATVRVKKTARKSPTVTHNPVPKLFDKIGRRALKKIDCRYCQKPFVVGLRVHRHEAKFCPLRPESAEIVEYVKPTPTVYKYSKRCCTICGKWVYKLKLHLSTHSATPQFECQHCHKRFKSLAIQKKHQAVCPLLRNRQKPDLTEKPFVCDTCGKSFALNGLLSQHKKAHIRIPCPKCNVMISKAAEFTHMLVVHDEVAMVCDLCGKVQKNRYVLNAHIRRYHPDEAQLLACDKCGKKFKDKQQLKLHSTTHVVGHNEQSCERCGLRFFTYNALKMHIRTVHKRSASRECPVCGLTLSSSNTLKVHERQHTGVKPYICDLCGKEFTQKPPLNRHKRTQHGIIPLLTEKCPQCDKMFQSKAVLKTHMIKMH